MKNRIMSRFFAMAACLSVIGFLLPGCSDEEEISFDISGEEGQQEAGAMPASDGIVTEGEHGDDYSAGVYRVGSSGDGRVGSSGDDNVGDDSVSLPGSIFVYICGEVVKPGVYEMPEGSRLYEVLQRCGGFTPAAASAYLNQAQLLSDGEKIYVPDAKEIEQQGMYGAGDTAGTESIAGAVAGMPEDGRVNINTADEAALQGISGIGARRAADIISYRESNGAFRTIEDIMKVPGIKEGLFSRIRDQIRV